MFKSLNYFFVAFQAKYFFKNTIRHKRICKIKEEQLLTSKKKKKESQLAYN